MNHHFPSNVIDPGNVTYDTLVAQKQRQCGCHRGQRCMSRTQFLPILRECSGAPWSKTRISFLYYTVHSRYNVHPDSHKSARLKFKVACIRFAEEI